MIFKAAEDFKKRTLSALPTLVEKVAYICSLQTSTGGYVHWGFARAFGNRPTQEAIYAAHLETAQELVQVPVREIFREYQEGLGRPQSTEILSPGHFTLKAPLNGDALLSAHLHLLQNSVVALAQQKSTTHQVA
ncbi:MAG TPA: hypothetical protein VFT65_17860 [Candidatus Angelobacter sp.]|nr:hypothetical protein [Candidatus Angelobacter sp.]